MISNVKVNRKAEAKKIFVHYVAGKRAQNRKQKTTINQRRERINLLPNSNLNKKKG